MRAGLIQLNSGDDPLANLAITSQRVTEAATQGARLVLTPEVTNCVSMSRARQHDVLRTEEEDPTLAGLRDLATRHGIWCLIGSLALKTDGPKFANRSFLVTPTGEIAARYDKIHMFDVDLGNGEVYRESDGYAPGDRAVLTAVDDVPLGMTICYDLRFPGLYRQLAQAGAQILTIPSAFTRPSGQAHWEPLLRARAIETGCFVLAPAQTGLHPTSTDRQRATYGHSLAIDPWGGVLIDMGEAPGVITIDLDLEQIATSRRKVGSLRADTPFAPPLKAGAE